MSKKAFILSICLVFLTISLFSQEGEIFTKPKPKLVTSGATYALPDDPEPLKSFTVSYQISEHLFAEINGYHISSPTIDIFKIPITMKTYVTRKLYVRAGIELQYLNDKLSSKFVSNQLDFITGLGYDVNSNFSLEIQNNYNVSTSGFNPIIQEDSFSLKGKVRF